MTYNEWINENIPDSYGACREATRDMQKAFPELRRVRGHYHCWIWGVREHWWLVDGDEIVDPTAAQFPSKGQGRYKEFEGQEPTGKCINCGKYYYNGEAVCQQSCYDEFVRSLL